MGAPQIESPAPEGAGNGAEEALGKRSADCSTWSDDQLIEALGSSSADLRHRASTELDRRQQATDGPIDGGPKILYRRAADITQRPIEWLWPGRIAAGKVTMISGHPGLGKSQLTASLASIVTTGGQWPVDGTNSPHGSVVILSAEDDPEDVIVPRLRAAGADLQRAYVVDAIASVDEDGRPTRRSPDITRDLEYIDMLLRRVGDAALVVIDPITAYLGSVDSHRNAEVRAVLAPLADMAARHRAAVVAISHLTKSGGTDAMLRVMGSLAFVAAARAAYIVARDPDDEHRRLFLPAKNNLGVDTDGYAYRIETADLGDGIETSRILWDSEAVTTTADEALSPEPDDGEKTATDEAVDFLSSLLVNGPMPAREIKRQARDADIGDKPLRTARNRLGIKPRKTRFDGGWEWALPESEGAQDAPQGAQDAHAQRGAPSGHDGTFDVSAAEIEDGEL